MSSIGNINAASNNKCALKLAYAFMRYPVSLEPWSLQEES